MPEGEKVVERMEACPTCSALAMLFVCPRGENLMRILVVSNDKEISVDEAADLLLDAGYKALHGKGVPPKKRIPVVQVRQHDRKLEDRVRDMEETERQTGRKVVTVGLMTSSTSLGIPKTIHRSALLSSMFANRFRNGVKEMEIAVLGLKGGERYEAEKKKFEEEERDARRARLSEVADFLLESVAGHVLSSLEHMWKKPKNKKIRRLVERRGWEWTKWCDSFISREKNRT